MLTNIRVFAPPPMESWRISVRKFPRYCGFCFLSPEERTRNKLRSIPRLWLIATPSAIIASRCFLSKSSDIAVFSAFSEPAKSTSVSLPLMTFLVFFVHGANMYDRDQVRPRTFVVETGCACEATLLCASALLIHILVCSEPPFLGCFYECLLLFLPRRDDLKFCSFVFRKLRGRLTANLLLALRILFTQVPQVTELLLFLLSINLDHLNPELVVVHRLLVFLDFE
mmetsp:Transcript_35469/g.57464  ORF Transcript_35469/g.57464 Transcript_35469/m.57464 type:complete len:226 (-) Transcript_35469:1305-1982(-)